MSDWRMDEKPLILAHLDQAGGNLSESWPIRELTRRRARAIQTYTVDETPGTRDYDDRVHERYMIFQYMFATNQYERTTISSTWFSWPWYQCVLE